MLLTAVIPQNPVCFGCSCAAAGISETAEPKTGDINQDGKVDVEDAQTALNEYANGIAGIKSSLTAEQILLADVNADKTVSAEDAQFILLYYVANTLSKTDTTWEQILHPESQTAVLDAETGINYPRPTGETVLRIGSEGGEVGWVQSALNKLLDARMTENCSYDDYTAFKERAFQLKCDLPAKSRKRNTGVILSARH